MTNTQRPTRTCRKNNIPVQLDSDVISSSSSDFSSDDSLADATFVMPKNGTIETTDDDIETDDEPVAKRSKQSTDKEKEKDSDKILGYAK